MKYYTNDEDLWELTQSVKSSRMNVRFHVSQVVNEINKDICNHYKYGSSRLDLYFMNKRIKKLNKMLYRYGFNIVVDVKYE
uniref:Uncharacterized protein n=1 Tax=viral metagenome TaxID=1070528 RepID=A0A6C0E0K9_9ZZZZ